MFSNCGRKADGTAAKSEAPHSTSQNKLNLPDLLDLPQADSSSNAERGWLGTRVV